MVTVVIMVIVLIILASVFFVNSTKPIEEASETKFLQELSEVKKGVNVKRIANAKEGTDEKTLNKGFIKVKVEDAPEAFVSFDENEMTGYVVDLATIEYEKLLFGRGYMDIIKGDTITFNEDDVYIYDKAGNVYYAKGFEITSGDSYYTETSTEERLEGPTVQVLDTRQGRIEIEVTPLYGGTISSVVVGGKLASTSDGKKFTITVQSNGSYLIIATEEGGGTTRETCTVTDITEASGALPVITNVYINSQERYTNTQYATVHIEAENAEYLSFSYDNLVYPDVNNAKAWRRYSETVSINLKEGINKVYVWAKNDEDDISEYKMTEITLDTFAPTREEPTYQISDFKLTMTGKQTDTTELTYEYGYKILGESSFTWQSSNIIEAVKPGAQYVIGTRAKDAAGNSSESRTVTTTQVPTIPSNIEITCTPTAWSTSKEVTITYPNTHGVSPYENIYRINGGEWQTVSSNTEMLEIISNSTIEATVSANLNGVDTEVGTITTLEVTTVDRLSPIISNIEKEIEGEVATDSYNITAEIVDEESGLTAWTITNSSTEPTVWDNILDATNEIQNISFEVLDNNTYYIWAKDLIGQTTMETIVVDNIDATDPEVKSYEVIYDVGTATINAIVQDESMGLVAYAVIQGEGKAPSSSDWVTIEKTTEEYLITHPVTENDYYTIWLKDASGRISGTPKYIKVLFKITYDYQTNGGESINISNNVIYQECNTDIDLSPVATKSSGDFKGWNTDPNATEGLASCRVGTVEDVVLYAIFSEEIEISLMYYDGQTLKRETITRQLYNSTVKAEVELPNIETTYTGWIQNGWTTETTKDATVEYSGENITIETDSDMTLYMTYRKNVAATCRYYTYKTLSTVDNTSNYLYIEEVDNGGTKEYRCYYPSSEISTAVVHVNSYDIGNISTDSITIPEVPTEVKYQNASNIWTLRGWSDKIDSDAEAVYSKGDEVLLDGDKTFYASYGTTVEAIKYMHDAQPEVVTGEATMTYNAVIAPATVTLGTASDTTYKGATWEARGWGTTSSVNAAVAVENEGNAQIYRDTNFYAMYERDVKITSYHYGNQTVEQISSAYLNYSGDTQAAKFVMNDIPSVNLDGEAWQARGYSLEQTPDGAIALSAGSTTETDEDLTYYISYYNDVKVTRKNLRSESVINGTAYVSYDGTYKKAKINLGEIESEFYNGYNWKGMYWSLDATENATEDTAVSGDVEVAIDTMFYAIFNRDVLVKKHTYINQTAEETGTALLNATGKIKFAEINLGTSENVTHDGLTWELKEWRTSANPDDTSATSIAVNGVAETYEDIEYYALYGNDVDVEVYYYNETGTSVHDILTGYVRLTHAGNVASGSEVQLPKLADVSKYDSTWVALGYLTSEDGYTIADKKGNVSATSEETIKPTGNESYFAIYQTGISINKTEYDKTSTIEESITMNSRGEREELEILLGSISDVIIDGKLWNGNGWSLTKEAADSPEIGTSDKVTINSNATYYASYGRELTVEMQEFASLGTSTSKFKNANVYMNVEGTKKTANITSDAPTNEQITLDGSTWNFKGWMKEINPESDIFVAANSNMEISDDIVLYAKYGRDVKATLYTHNNYKLGEYPGVIQANPIGEIANASIKLDTITTVNVDGEDWTGRGWSTNTSSTAGENFVEPGGYARISGDTTYYASYKKDITTNFISYNGTEQVTKKRISTGYMDYVGGTTGATIIVPSQETYGIWIADGYTSTTDVEVADNDKVSGIITVTNSTDYYGLYYRDITVTYDSNGGTPTLTPSVGIQRTNSVDVSNTVDPTIIVTSGEMLRTGYTFTNTWTPVKDVLENSIAGGDEVTFTEDTTLYAYWEPKVYTLTYDLQGGNGNIPSVEKTYGQDITISTTDPTLDGSIFMGWTLTPDSEVIVYKSGDTFNLNEDTTLYAYWRPIIYTVTYNLKGGNEDYPAQTKLWDEEITLYNTHPTKRGSLFLGWSTDAEAVTVHYDPGTKYSANKDLTLYAVWYVDFTISDQTTVNNGDYYGDFVSSSIYDGPMGSQTDIYNDNNGKLQYDENGNLLLDDDNAIPILSVNQNYHMNEGYTINTTISGDIYQYGNDHWGTDDYAATVLALSDEDGKYLSWIGYYKGFLHVYSFKTSAIPDINYETSEKSFASIDIREYEGQAINVQVVSEKGGYTRVYINGELKVSFPSGDGYFSCNYATLGDFRAGRGLKFRGTVYNVELYGLILTEDQIQTNWEAAQKMVNKE